MAKPALGRGLGALLGGAQVAKPPVAPDKAHLTPAIAVDTRERVERVPLQQVKPCALQPRKSFPSESLKELADSIREQGIVQPLIVRGVPGKYELIAGERRWRAAQLAGLTEVPVIVRGADDKAVLELALIENLQRENLNPVEEAQGYSQLISQFGLTQEEVSAKVGKNRATVANALRLLRLPPQVQDWLRDQKLTAGHAKALLGLSTEPEQQSAAARVLREGLNVRQTEALVVKLQARTVGGSRIVVTGSSRDPHVTTLEDKLRQRLGTKVCLRYNAGKGAVEIAFFSDAELERVLDVLGVDAG
jgi:ParB family chromosome partitioning protein